jgi:hypothetical protein
VAILVLSAPLAGRAVFKARRLLPLLVVTLLALFLRATAAGVPLRTGRRLAGICGAVGVLALGLRFGEVWTGPMLGTRLGSTCRSPRSPRRFARWVSVRGRSSPATSRWPETSGSTSRTAAS